MTGNHILMFVSLSLLLPSPLYKGHMDKIKGEGIGGGGRWDWRDGEKMQTIIAEYK